MHQFSINKQMGFIRMEKYSIFFMLEGDGFGIELETANAEAGPFYLDLLSCFGTLQNDCFNLLGFNSPQLAAMRLSG